MALSLAMRQWRYGKLSKGFSQWRVASVDNTDAVFPDDQRLGSLFKTHSPVEGELTVLYRGSNNVVIQIPAGLTPAHREPFRRAVETESTLK